MNAMLISNFVAKATHQRMLYSLLINQVPSTKHQANQEEERERDSYLVTILHGHLWRVFYEIFRVICSYVDRLELWFIV